MTDEKELTVRIKYVTDESGIKDSKKAADTVANGVKDTGSQAGKSEEKVKGLNKQMDNLLKASAALAVVSGGAFKLMTGSIDAYTKQMGATEASSRRWLMANQSIEMSGTRIGRVFAEQAIPWMEKYSAFMDHAAAFAEKNPGLVDAGLKIAAGGAALGAVGTVASLGSKIFTSLGGNTALAAAGKALSGTYINSAGGVGAAAYGPAQAAAPVAAGATGLGAILSGLGGVGLGIGANELLAKATGEKPIESQLASDFLQGLLSAISPGMGMVVSEMRKRTGTSSQLGFTSIEKYGAVASGAAAPPAATDSNNSRLGGFLANQILIYNQYYRQEEQAQRAYLLNLARSKRDFEMQQQYEQEDFNRARARSVRDFARQESQDTIMYQIQRSRAVRDFGIQMVRSEEDFQRQRSRAAEDFQFQLWDIARSGDAFSYMQATRQYAIQQSRSEEDYDISRARQIEDFNRSQADQQADWDMQRAFRLQNFAIQLADQQQDFDTQRLRQAQQRATQLADMQQDYNEQKRLRKQAVTDALDTMSDGTEKAAKLFQNFTGSMVADMQTLVDNAALLKDYFDKLPAPTANTPAAQVASGNSNQSNGVTSGGTNVSQLTINDHRRFDSRLSPEDRRSIRQDNELMLTGILQ
jgi:hypothetical protein